jgi:hypothetical protein
VPATLVSRGIHVGTPAMLTASECASADIALSTLEERGARREDHEYEMLTYPETVTIARLITRPAFKNGIQDPAHLTNNEDGSSRPHKYQFIHISYKQPGDRRKRVVPENCSSAQHRTHACPRQQSIGIVA